LSSHRQRSPTWLPRAADGPDRSRALDLRAWTRLQAHAPLDSKPADDGAASNVARARDRRDELNSLTSSTHLVDPLRSRGPHYDPGKSETAPWRLREAVPRKRGRRGKEHFGGLTFGFISTSDADDGADLTFDARRSGAACYERHPSELESSVSGPVGATSADFHEAGCAPALGENSRADADAPLPRGPSPRR